MLLKVHSDDLPQKGELSRHEDSYAASENCSVDVFCGCKVWQVLHTNVFFKLVGCGFLPDMGM